MLGYIIRRILVAIVITIGIAAITFVLLHLISGSPVHEVLGAQGAAGRGRRVEQAARLRPPGDRPVPDAIWAIWSCLNFGYSYKLGAERQRAVQGERRPQRSTCPGRALRALAADRDPARDRPGGQAQHLADYTVTTLNFVLYSMPSFFLGMILIQFFALDLHIFPPLVPSSQHDHLAALTHPRN